MKNNQVVYIEKIPAEWAHNFAVKVRKWLLIIIISMPFISTAWFCKCALITSYSKCCETDIIASVGAIMLSWLMAFQYSKCACSRPWLNSV